MVAITEANDIKMLKVAKALAQFSEEPEHKVAAIITDSYYNIKAHGVNYTNSKGTVIHAEEDAIDMFCSRSDLEYEPYFIFIWPFQCCLECANFIQGAELNRVVTVANEISKKHKPDEARELLDAAGISLSVYPLRFFQ